MAHRIHGATEASGLCSANTSWREFARAMPAQTIIRFVGLPSARRLDRPGGETASAAGACPCWSPALTELESDRSHIVLML